MQKTLTFLAPLAIAACLALPASAQDDLTVDTVVATVNGTDITLGHMIVARATLPEQYQQLPDDVLFNGILDQLIQQTALADTFNGTLPGRVTLALENETRSLTAGEVVENIMANGVTDEDIAAAYAEQYTNAEPEAEFNASHILVETEEAAQAVIAELEGGADFAAVAREKSTGPSGPGGGSLGWFGKGMMVPSFEAAVIDMEVGAISAPVETQFGWHVIKLNESRKTEAPSLESVQEELRLQVGQTKVQTAIEDITAAATVNRDAANGVDPSVIKNIDWLE